MSSSTLPRFPDIWDAAAEMLRPPPQMPTREFSLFHRILHREYCVENPGPWRHDKFPYQPGIMDAIDEAVATGKIGIAFMKAGQIGGSDVAINGLMNLKLRFPGPALFMTSTDKVAEEFGDVRFRLLLRDMEPLRKKQIDTHREKMLVKRFIDGPLVLCGGGSVNNLQSNPYRFAAVDEWDSLAENLGGDGDPIQLLLVRMDSFDGVKLIIGYAHPSVRTRGVGKCYYKESDQRRGHITHKCGHEFWLDWFNRDVFNYAPRLPGQTLEQAEKDAQCWYLQCPGCGQRISEEERVVMLHAGIKQKSVLPPEEAAKKTWIGVHASQLYTPGKTIQHFAERWIATDCGRDENAARVFVNKVLGDIYEPKIKEVTIDALRKLAVVRRGQHDPEFYSRGQVPPWVLFMTGGQDSRHKELHYTLWGWGVRETIDRARYLCGALIDYAEINRDPPSATFTDAEYHVFDDAIYRMLFPCTAGGWAYSVRACGHDIGYQPTQIPIIRYCRSWPGRAMPCKGASEDHSSASLAQPVHKGTAKRYKVGELEVFDDPQLLMNTFMLKEAWYGMVEQRIQIAEMRDGHQVGVREVPRIVLPENVTELWLEQSKNEKMVPGEKSGELIWKATGPNHIADCNTYAYGAALYLDPHSRNQTAEEYRQRTQPQRPTPPRRPPAASHDPSMG